MKPVTFTWKNPGYPRLQARGQILAALHPVGSSGIGKPPSPDVEWYWETYVYAVPKDSRGWAVTETEARTAAVAALKRAYTSALAGLENVQVEDNRKGKPGQ